ncbi:MAG: permease [Deltaproteobacteria bacterium]|nr:permease [Deltaproteobacteria bacterium]
MWIATGIMAALAVILFVVGAWRGQGQHLDGLKAGGQMTLQVLPLLIFAFLVAGMAQSLIPKELIARWVGGESGWRGILIGSLAGGLTPGGPYVSFPIVAGLYRAGASIGTTVAFVTAWSLWAVTRLPMEVGLMGLRFTLVRLLCTLVFPPLAGWMAQLLFGR